MMRKSLLFISLSFFPLVQNAWAGNFFFWLITDSNGENFRRIPNYESPLEYHTENSDWNCIIKVPNGFRADALVKGDGKLYQEGTTIVCNLKSNPQIGVQDYGACTKRGNEAVANSGPSLELNTRKGKHLISAVCSEKRWSTDLKDD